MLNLTEKALQLLNMQGNHVFFSQNLQGWKKIT